MACQLGEITLFVHGPRPPAVGSYPPAARPLRLQKKKLICGKAHRINPVPRTPTTTTRPDRGTQSVSGGEKREGVPVQATLAHIMVRSGISAVTSPLLLARKVM